MKFWPFPLLMNYETSAALTRLFLEMAADPTLRIDAETAYDLTLSGVAGKLKFWNENRYYAWANSGEYTRPDGVVERWKGMMPSRWAISQMRQAVDGARFNPAKAVLA